MHRMFVRAVAPHAQGVHSRALTASVVILRTLEKQAQHNAWEHARMDITVILPLIFALFVLLVASFVLLALVLLSVQSVCNQQESCITLTQIQTIASHNVLLHTTHHQAVTLLVQHVLATVPLALMPVIASPVFQPNILALERQHAIQLAPMDSFIQLALINASLAILSVQRAQPQLLLV